MKHTKEENTLKKFSVLFITFTLLFVLSACGQTAKQTYTEAYQGLMDAKSYETTSTFNIDLEAENASSAPEQDMLLGLVNNAEIKVDSRFDKEKEISEVIFQVKTNQGPMSFNLEIPMHINMEDQKIYVKTEAIKQALMMIPFAPVPPDFTFEKEFLELNAGSQLNVEDQKQFEQQMREQIDKLLNDLSEDSFQEKEDTIELNLKGEQIKDLFIRFIEEAMELSGEMLNGAEKEEFKQAIEEIKFNSLDIKSQIDGGKMNTEDISFAMEAGEGEEKVNIQIKVLNEYKKINEAVTFTMDPTEENTMTEQELTEQFNQIMMGAMMQPSIK